MSQAAVARSLPGGWTVLVLPASLLVGVGVGLAGPATGVLAVVGIAAALAVAYAPGFVLAAYLLIPFYKGAIDPYSPIDLTIVLALANGTQAIALLVSKRPIAVSRAGVALWIGLAILVLAGVLYAPDQALAFGKAINYWVLVLVAILPAALRVGSDMRWVHQFLVTFFVMGVVTVVLGVGQISTGARLTVLGMNTIQVGRAALLATVVGVSLILPRRHLLLSVLVALMVPVSIVVALASGSRGPILMLVALGLIGGARHVATYRSRAWRTILGVIALALLSVAVFSTVAAELPAAALGRFGSLASFLGGGASAGGLAGTETSAAARVSFAGFAAGMFADSPVIGAGTAGFQALFQAAHGPDTAAYPHNAFLQVAAEHGLLGLAAFLGLLAVAFTRPLPRGDTTLALWFVAVFFVLNAMVSGDVFTGRETLGLILLLLVVSTRATDGAPTSAAPAGAAPGTPQPAAAMSR